MGGCCSTAPGLRVDTFLRLDDLLPLTCSRAGTCCHGKAIFLNPWELACLAREKGCSAREFRDRFTVGGGVRLRMGASPLQTCSQYAPSRGCSVYAGRPLACRLFPLGRQRQGESVTYLHRGEAFPCLAGCPEVGALPRLSVAAFLEGQQVEAGEAAQDAYLELTLDLAEGALVLLLEGGLAASGDRQTLPRWRSLGAVSDEARAAAVSGPALDLLMLPGLEARQEAPAPFVAQHRLLLQAREESLAAPASIPELRERCCEAMGLALCLGRAVGIDAAAVAQHWIAIAERNGAAR